MKFPAYLSAILALAFCASASAALIPVSIRYDANVKRNSDVGVEKHFSNNTAQLLSGLPDNLPADNSMLPGTLLDGNSLNFNMTQVDGHAILIITDTFGQVFNNPADPAFTYPVQFDGLFYSDSLDPGQSLNVTDIQYESPTSGLPFPAPTSEMISAGGPNFGDPLGSINNPVRIKLGFTASEIGITQLGWNKFHIFYDTPNDFIPEPTSIGLALLGVGGILFARRQRFSR
jgi:hypothetical protein